MQKISPIIHLLAATMLPSTSSFLHLSLRSSPTRLFSASPPLPNPSSVLTSTRTWLYNFVLPLKLCPFAYRPLVTSPKAEFRLSYVDPTLPLTSLLRELESVSELTAMSPHLTSIVVCPNPDLADFLDYMEFVNGHVNKVRCKKVGRRDFVFLAVCFCSFQ